jgi:hypothetical protein
MREISKHVASDGTINYEYTWGRPVTTYLSSLEHMRLLLFKARLSATRDLDTPGPDDSSS